MQETATQRASVSRSGRGTGAPPLESRGSGTHITYTIEVYPRSFMGRPIVALELKRITKPKIDAVIAVMLARLAGEDRQYDPLPDPLPKAAEERMLQLVPRVHDERSVRLLELRQGAIRG